MELARLLDPDPLAGLMLIRILLCLAALPTVWCAIKWGEKFHGIQGTWIAGLFTALWPDLWLMAPHPLEEILAADILVPAIYLIGVADNLKRVAWAGFLLGMAFTLRLQLAPAIAIAGIVLCGRPPWRWLAALPAGAAPVLAVGLLDWATWGEPFRSFWLNIYLNVFRGVAAHEFGTEPLTYYIFMMGLDWFWTFPVILVLAWFGARRVPLAGSLALVILLTHSLISHKEYRFIFPAIALAIPLAGLGLAELAARLQQAGALSRGRIFLGAVLLCGPFFSPWLYFMLTWQASAFHVFENVVARQPTLVSLQGWTEQSFLPFDIVFPGTTRLTRQTITPTLDGPLEADVIVASATTGPIPPDFTKQICYPGIWIPLAKTPHPQTCIFVRPGAKPATTDAAPPFVFPFPQAARAFIIPDRLTDK
jgi:hypothetical protein